MVKKSKIIKEEDLAPETYVHIELLNVKSLKEVNVKEEEVKDTLPIVRNSQK